MHLKSLFSTSLPLPPSPLPSSTLLTPQPPSPPLPPSSPSAHRRPCQRRHHHRCSRVCFPGGQALNVLTPAYSPPPLVALILSLPFKFTDADPLSAHTGFALYALLVRPYRTVYGRIDTRPVPLAASVFGLRYGSLPIHTVLQP